MPATHRPVATAVRFGSFFGDAPIPWATARAAGFSRAALDAALDRGLLIRPRRGWIQARPSPDPHALLTGPFEEHPALAEQRHRSDVAALTSALGAVATHESAAIVHGLLRPDPRVPHEVQLARPSSGFLGPGIRVRTSPVPDHVVTMVDGIPVTSVARTAVDLARSEPLPRALIPVDAAARRLIADRTGATGNRLRQVVRDGGHRAYARAELRSALDSCFGWAGTVAARTAIDLLDPASESATESRSRGWFLEAGLRRLAVGHPIAVGATTYWADFCAPEARVVGEADGWSKYDADAAEHRRAVSAERERQQSLEAAGWRVVRWTSTESRRAVVTRMTNALRLN